MGTENTVPVREYVYRCMKGTLLNFLIEELHQTALIHEDMLCKLEVLEELDYRLGSPVSASFSAAYCAVAVECTVKYIGTCSSRDAISRKSAYVNAINRIWRGHIPFMESSSSSGLGCRLYTAELKQWSDDIEASLSDPKVLKRLESYNSRKDAIWKLKVYLLEALEDLAPYYDEIASFASSIGDNCQTLELGGDKQESSAHAFLQRVNDRNVEELPIEKQTTEAPKENWDTEATFGNQSTEPPNEEIQITEAPHENQTKEAPSEIHTTESLIENMITEEAPSEIQTEEALIENQTTEARIENMITEKAPSEIQTEEAPIENQTTEALIENQITEEASDENQTKEALIKNQTTELIENQVTEEVPNENPTEESPIENQILEEALDGNQAKEAPTENQTTDGLIVNQITEEAPNENQTKEAPIHKIADALNENQIAGAPTENVGTDTGLHDQHVFAKECNESEQGLDEGASDHATKFHLPSPKKWKISPLRKYEPQNIIIRRKKKRWSESEEITLRSAVNQYGEGNWKLILSTHMDVFEERTEVDLKDKWRNLKHHRAN